MKDLAINPQKYDITLSADDSEAGIEQWTEVTYQFGDHRGTHCLDVQEAKKIGKWFTDLAEELAKKKT